MGKITVCFPRYLLVERGLIFRRSYYVPLSLVQGVEGQRVRLEVSEATLAERGYANVPSELYHVPRQRGATVFPDISGASLLGKYPPTPAETGFYAPYEIDPYGRPVDRPAKLYSTGKLVHSRTLRLGASSSKKAARECVSTS